MRQGPSGRRPRGRHHGGNSGHNNGGNSGPVSGPTNSGRGRSAASLRHQTFDSNGPEVRVRGNAWQVYEKYQALARDSQSSGDRVNAENLLQHAEHYYRIIEAINDAATAEQRTRSGSPTQPFGQQPDMPANYYTPDGQLAAPRTTTSVATTDGSSNDEGPAQADVQHRPKAASTFLTAGEAEDTASEPEPLRARR